jgi:hypothetical protein
MSSARRLAFLPGRPYDNVVNEGPLGMWGEWLVEDKACTVDKLAQDSRREAIARAKLGETRDVILAKAGNASTISKDAAVSRELKRPDGNRTASAARAAEGGEPQSDGNLLRTVAVGAVVETNLIFVGGSAEAGAAIDMTGHRGRWRRHGDLRRPAGKIAPLDPMGGRRRDRSAVMRRGCRLTQCWAGQGGS